MVGTQQNVTGVESNRMSMPGVLLRVEGAVVLVVATAVYFTQGYTWWLFPLLLLAPDLSALGYLFGTRVGSVTYNLFHMNTLPLLLLAGGWWLDLALAVSLALIWLVHIGMDRMVGYGLKYPDSFKHNHLHEV